MKRLVTILLIPAGAVASAQDYPKYTVSKTLHVEGLGASAIETTLHDWIRNEGFFWDFDFRKDLFSKELVYNVSGRFNSKIRDIWWFLLGDSENDFNYTCAFNISANECVVTASDFRGSSYQVVYGQGGSLIRESYPNARTYNRDVKALERFNEYFNEFCNSLYEYLCVAVNS